MSAVAISAYRVATTPQFGGHFWVYMQYAHALRQLGFDVWWLERIEPQALQRVPAAIPRFLAKMRDFGLEDRVLLYDLASPDGDLRFITVSDEQGASVLRRTEFLLNFDYATDERVLRRFPRTVLVDIDPGLLQWWISRGQLNVAPHDAYLTTGETVGDGNGLIEDCGLRWIHIPPPVCLDLWQHAYDPSCRRYTTVSSWLGGEYVTEDDRIVYRNDKSISFLRFAELPLRTAIELELAIYLKGREDRSDRALLERHGWRVRHASEVSQSAAAYRAYIQSSRGEFSCAKPSCIEFQNAWVSDRTLCYLASGKPVVAQHTGPSSYLPDGEGMFRFSTLEDAVWAFAEIERDYRRHCDVARAIAETHFDASAVLRRVADLALALPSQATSRPAERAGGVGA